MKQFEKTVQYLNKIFGAKPLLSAFVKSQKGIPLFLKERYVLGLWKWSGKEICLASSTDSLQNELTPSEISKDSEKLTNIFNMPVVMVFKSITPYQRMRLLQCGTPFLVPDSQLFIPPFMDLTESFRHAKHGRTLSGTAQLILLYQILKHPAEPLPIKEWAKITGRSAVMVSKACAELAEHGICEESEMRRNRKGVRFTAEKLELWQKALPCLRSPVVKRLWGRFQPEQKTPDSVLAAGLSALDKKTMLTDDPVPSGACDHDTVKKLIESGKFIVCEDSDLADIRLECWSYAPRRLSDSNMVDELSLWLSLADSNDERVEQAREELLRNFRW